jgi:hypothetical protein
MEATTHTLNPTPAEKLGGMLGGLIVILCIAVVLTFVAYAYFKNANPVVVVLPAPPYLEVPEQPANPSGIP